MSRTSQSDMWEVEGTEEVVSPTPQCNHKEGDIWSLNTVVGADSGPASWGSVLPRKRSSGIWRMWIQSPCVISGKSLTIAETCLRPISSWQDDKPSLTEWKFEDQVRKTCIMSLEQSCHRAKNPSECRFLLFWPPAPHCPLSGSFLQLFRSTSLGLSWARPGAGPEHQGAPPGCRALTSEGKLLCHCVKEQTLAAVQGLMPQEHDKRRWLQGTFLQNKTLKKSGVV